MQTKLKGEIELFASGDVVYLRSDDVAMTVESVSGDAAAVAWHSADKVMQRATLPLATLVHVPAALTTDLSGFRSDWYDHRTQQEVP